MIGENLSQMKGENYIKKTPKRVFATYSKNKETKSVELQLCCHKANSLSVNTKR